MNIKKIELQSGGFKGATIVFTAQIFKNNRPFLNETVEKRKHPIHVDFENLFKELRVHLIELFKMNSNGRLSEAELKTLILETDVHSIEFDNDSFMIKGESEVFGDKKIDLKTCKVQQSDDYEGYEDVRNIIENLKTEATSYLDGLKLVSDREMMLRYIEAKKDAAMTKEIFESLSEADQKAYMNKTLNSKFGANIEIEEEEQEEQEEGEDEGIDIDGEVVIDIPEIKSSKKETVKPEKF